MSWSHGNNSKEHVLVSKTTGEEGSEVCSGVAKCSLQSAVIQVYPLIRCSSHVQSLSLGVILKPP